MSHEELKKYVKQRDAEIDASLGAFLRDPQYKTLNEAKGAWEKTSDDFWEWASTALTAGIMGKAYQEVIAQNADSNSN